MADTLSLLYTSDYRSTFDFPDKLRFHKITARNMPLVWHYMQREKGRTCDFSYGGVLMWVDMFDYEMAICHDTLFIKGRLENDLSLPAFSLPVGSQSLADSVSLLQRYSREQGMPLRFSAIPEYCIAAFSDLCPRHVDPLDDWSDYLYDINSLATLAGKKMAKKRNHVNQYVALCGSDTYEPLTRAALPDLCSFMDSLEAAGAPSAQADEERRLTRKVLDMMNHHDMPMQGGLLRADGRVVAFTIGDVKGDTLFVHIEKALRDVPGSYEMINKCFAADMLARYPHLSFVNREDDAGDEGLRKAKLSYHPVEILKKYNVVF